MILKIKIKYIWFGITSRCNISTSENTTKIWICEIYIGNPEIDEIGSGMKLLFTFLGLRFFEMRRERHNFLLCWLFVHRQLSTHWLYKRATHFVDPSWSCLGELRKIDFLRPSPDLNSLLFSKFQNPQPIVFGHDVLQVPGPISYLEFSLWYVWLSHPLRSRVNTYTQCVHLTNPCTKGSQPN